VRFFFIGITAPSSVIVLFFSRQDRPAKVVVLLQRMFSSDIKINEQTRLVKLFILIFIIIFFYDKKRRRIPRPKQQKEAGKTPSDATKGS
jgi:hypothetical protein